MTDPATLLKQINDLRQFLAEQQGEIDRLSHENTALKGTMDPEKVGQDVTGEVMDMQAEIEALKADNAALRQKIASIS